MQLKKPFVLAMSLCMAFGVGMTAAACDNDSTTDDITYTINIDIEETSALSDLKVLFYSDDASKSVTISGTSASAELPKGDYFVYLTGQLPGYTYTPVKLSKAQTSANLYVTEVEEENGKVPYQFLVLYPGGEKIFKGSDENYNSVQVCTTEGQDVETKGCFDFYFNENYIACLASWEEPLLIQPAYYDIHLLEKNWPEGYTFDETQYEATATPAGGSYTIELKAL